MRSNAVALGALFRTNSSLLCITGFCAFMLTIIQGFVIVGVPEEAMKVSFTGNPDPTREAARGTKADLIYSTAFALGFAIAMCVVYTMLIGGLLTPTIAKDRGVLFVANISVAL